MKSDTVVYTAITKGYDTLKTPVLNSGLDFVCFTDDTFTSDVWDFRPINLPDISDPVRKARFIKLHPHLMFPDYKWSIWVDGSLSIIGDLSVLQKEVQARSNFGVYAHAKRDCLYQAALNCIDKKKDDTTTIQKQMEKYKKLGYPENQGLVSSGVLVRNHHDLIVSNLMEAWWHEIDSHSRRDQLSFNYICWQKNFSYYAIPKRIGDGRFFRRNPHYVNQK